LVQLTSNYFQLLFVALVRCRESSPTPTSQQLQLDVNNVDHLTVSDFGYLYETYLGVEAPIEEDLGRKGGTLPHPNMDCVLSSFLSHLRVCDDAVIANQLLETLSVLGEFGEDSCFLSKVSEISWAAMHTNFPHQGEGAGLSTPYVFLEVLRRSMPSSFLASRQATPKEMALTSTIVKTARNNSRGTQKNSLLVNEMLRHWGLLVVSNPLEHHLHLSLLFDHLDNFLCDVYELFAAKQCDESKYDSSDEEYLPPAAKHTFNRSEHMSSMPGLNGESFPVYFEVLMHMVVASVSVAHPACNSPRGPFHHLECLVEIFGSLTRLFSEKIDIFPRHTASLVCNASKAMLSVSTYQLHQCVEWRNAQPVPSMPEWESGAEDPASFRYLHRLLQSLGLHLISPLKSLCDGANVGISESFSNLLSAFKKALQAIEDVATSHNLKPTRLGVQSAEDSKQLLRKRRRAVVVAGLHQFERTTRHQSPHRHATVQVTTQGHSTLGGDVVPQENQTLKATSTMPTGFYNAAENGTDDTGDDGRFVDDDMSHSSASFGASGDWPGLHSCDDHAIVSSECLLPVQILKQR
jgi:hypothetical protein